MMEINKIFGIGANKTATSSLTEALEKLGYRTSHWSHHHDICKQLIKNNFNFKFLNKFDAATDLPIPSIFDQLDIAYPNSKFILTIRDVDKWIQSEEKHHRNLQDPIFEVFLMYGSWTYNKDLFIKNYQEHNEKVKEYFKDRPEDLLIMDITKGDGWEKLCPFLGKDVPDSAFPFLNRSKLP
jgi:hypothetical protein